MKAEFGLIATPDQGEEIVYTLDSELIKNPHLYLIDQLADPRDLHLGRFYAGEGDQHYITTDSIPHTILRLCFHSIPVLLDDKEFEYWNFMCGVTTILTPREDRIEIVQAAANMQTGMYENGEVVTLDKKRLLVELYQCGCRYMELLKIIREQSISGLRPFADEALIALQRHSYI